MGQLMGGLEAEDYDRTYSDGVLLKRIVRYFKPKLRLIYFIAVFVVLAAALNALVPVLISNSLDQRKGSQIGSLTVILIGMVIASGILAWIFNFLRQWLTAVSVSDVVMRLQKDAFSSILERDLSFFDEYNSGKIVSRVTSDTEEFSKVVTLTLNLLSQSLIFFLIVGVLFYRNWLLTLITLTITPLIVLVAMLFRRFAREITRKSQRSLGRVNSNVQEAITGITVAKNFRQEQAMYTGFQEVNEQAYQVHLRSGFLYNGIFPMLFMIANLGTTLVVYFGGTGVYHGQISAGDWFLFIQSIGFFWLPLVSISSFWSQFQLGLAASERVFALLDAEARVIQRDALPVSEIRGEIEFRHLFFSYTDQQTVLKDFSLDIKPGEKVALVGHTGAGKSSLAKLVARFYEYQGGDLFIDGRDIRTLDLQQYRRHLGLVPQIPFLFSGTVAENIRYVRPEASEAEIERIASLVGNGDWLEALPEGLRTQVGEAGKGLSMGQRQLVALARVMLQRPEIIILDEATASVDPLTEAQIQEGMDQLLKGRTAILIAHRLSTVQHADRIIVLEQGRIVEEGSHQSLMYAGGHYAQLYNTYFRHQSPDYQPGEGFVPVKR